MGERDDKGIDLSELLHQSAERQTEPVHRGDNPLDRLSGTCKPPVGAMRSTDESDEREADEREADEREAAARARFSELELDLINAFLALKGYAPARIGAEGSPAPSTIVSHSAGDNRPGVAIRKTADGKFSFFVIERATPSSTATSYGYENVESLPLVLAMIDCPDRF